MPQHVRVYLPLTPDHCRTLAQHRVLPAPLEGYAVTGAVRSSDPGGDQESWEYAALQDAAGSALRAGRPVIIAAVDVTGEEVQDNTLTGSLVRITGDVPLPRVASFHVGDDVLGAATGDPDPDTEIELSWYDTTELSHLVSLV